MGGQTDRQTTRKSTWWSVTAFDEDGILKLEDKEHYPDFVVSVLGGKEECSKTNRIHFQGAVQTTQVRFSQMKRWLDKAHIEPAKNVQALKQYAMKEETAIEVKQVRVSNQRYYKRHEILDLMAQEYLKLKMTPSFMIQNGKGEFFYTYLVSKMLEQDRTIVNFIDGKLCTLWIDFHDVFIAHAEAPYSITGAEPGLKSDQASDGQQ